jgi:hypothetical protein
MRPTYVLTITFFALLLFACKKDHPVYNPPPPAPEPIKKVLLKDVVIPNLPSPFYHFEYRPDSLPSKVDFASGFSTYDVIYTGNKIAEMRNVNLVNHDTLRYIYGQDGKLGLIIFIDKSNVVYRHIVFTYNGDLVTRIDWDQKVGNVGYIFDRTLKFDYYPDGNVKTIAEHRPTVDGSPESNSTLLFEQYDDKINVDDFSLVHVPFNDHLFLFQGFRLQKNNPRKETFTQDSNLNNYVATYTYTYNSDGTPSLKSGVQTFTAGSLAGRTFQISTAYTYY